MDEFRDATPVRTVRAPNPGPLTGDGTNTYVVGAGTGAALVVDPGPRDAGHTDAVVAALDGARLDGVLVTHAHRDHSAGVDALRAAAGDAPVIAYGLLRAGVAPDLTEVAADLGGGEGLDRDFRADVEIEDGAAYAPNNGAFVLRALHTPGHAPDHVCFALEDGFGRLFSGDHAMGWATSLVSPPDGDMTAYMASLDRLIARDDRTLLPGHGPEIDAPSRLRALREHRRGRERSVLAALASRGPSTAADLVPIVYSDAPNAPAAAAARNVLAHLIDLSRRGAVASDGPLRVDARFSAE